MLSSFVEDLSSMDNLSSGSLDAILHSFKVQIADHVALVLGSLRVVHFFDESLASVNKCFMEVFVNQNVIWSNASLP